jgi:hypothetical protein
MQKKVLYTVMGHLQLQMLILVEVTPLVMSIAIHILYTKIIQNLCTNV